MASNRQSHSIPQTRLSFACNMAQAFTLRLDKLAEKFMEVESVVSQDRSVELQQFRAKLFSNWSS